MAGSDNFNFSDMQTDQGQRAAPNTPSIGFEAATAALDTNELLHLILAEVPRQSRTTLRSVSKKWKAAVEKVGHTFDPPRPVGNRGPHCMLPMYGINEFGKRLVCNKTNPAIACYTKVEYFDCPGCVDGQDWCDTCFDPVESIHARICFDPNRISKQEGEERELEFITDPPITLVEVSVGISRDWWRDSRKRQVSVLNVPGGIRVRDLKECFEKMSLCDYAYGKVASFAVLGQMQHEFCDPFPTPSRPNELPSPLDNCRRPRFESEIGESQEEIGDDDTPYASEVDDDSQSEEVSFSPRQYDQSPPDAEVQEYDAADSSQGEDGNFSPQQYDQSSPGEEVLGYEAATAALDTNELLHLIIAELPREQRCSLRRVSKNWQAAVVKLGYATEPLEYKNVKDTDPPEYWPGKALVFNRSNPWIACYTRQWDDDNYDDDGIFFASCPRIHASICFDPYGISDTPYAVKRELEFVTDPPVTQMEAVVGAHDPKTAQTTMIIRSGGIRVRDLRECFERMKRCDYAYSRVSSFAVLRQKFEPFGHIMPTFQPNEVPTPVCWLHVEDCSTLGGAGVDGESQEETGGGDTPYASESEESQGDDHEPYEVGSENDEAKSGYQSYQWRLQDELEQWSNSSQGDGCGTGYAETRGAGYAAGDDGEGVLASKEQEDAYEWNSESELEGWSYGSQRNGNDLGGGETPRADYHGQGDYGEVSPAREEPEDGHEWSWEAEVEKWSKGSQGDASETGGGDTPDMSTVDHQGQRGNGEAGFTREEPGGGHEWNFEAELEKWSKLD
jgi:hypothetical protein